MIKYKSLFAISGLLIFMILSMTGCQAGAVATDTPVEETAAEEVIMTEEAAVTEEDPGLLGDTWDLLWISDSSGWGVADIYGQFIAEDNDVEVNVMDKWQGALSAGRILQGLKEQNTYNLDLDNLREFIAEAEVIVIYGNPEDSRDPSNPGDWNCGQASLESCYVNNCTLESFSQYIADLKEIYSIIFKIREGKPTIIQAIDSYNPRLVSNCQAEGMFDECVACWETYNQAIHLAAEEMGVPVAPVFDTWNGPDHTENPVEKGYTREDNEHPSVLGATATAQALRELGYEPIIP